MSRAPVRSIAAALASSQSASLLPNRPAATGLPHELQQKFEGRLGADFSRVRVHCDDLAAAAADALGAKAFVVGNDVFFGANRWQPYTQEGSTLLAHELTHVAQQHRSGSANGVGDAEQRAQASAEQAVQGDSVSASEQGAADSGVYCDDDESKLKLDDRPLLSGVGYQPPKLSLLPPLTLGGGATPGLTPPAYTPPSYSLPPQLTLPPSYDVNAPRPPYASRPEPFSPLSPEALSAPGLNHADTLALFGSHGVSPGMLGINIMDDYAMAYQKFSYLPFGREWSANHFLSGAYSADLTRDHPNVFDRSNAEFWANNPGEFHTPIIPLITPDTLPYILKGFEYTGRGIGAGFQFVGDGISKLIGGKR